MSAGGSPPKPWERAAAGGASAAIPTASSLPGASTTTATAAMSSAANAPALPARTDALNAIATRQASAYSSPYNRASPYSSPYGMGGMSSYSSPYNRFGGGGMYGGGMYGSGYGMGGYGMGGYGGMYGGPGMYGPNGQEPSLTQSFGDSTQATFQMIEGIVGAFGGFAQMLESTYMATHSSFFAMVSVAEQFGNLRQTLGSILGVFALMRWTRNAVAKLTGRPPPADSKELTPANFAAFSGRPNPDGSPSQPRPSRKPFILFMLAVVGLPYLMGKLIRTLAAGQQADAQRQLTNDPNAQPLDPSKLDFCRVLYDYTPQLAPGQVAQEGLDLAVSKGDLVAVLSKTDPNGQPSEWWRCRARDGQMGYLPSPYLETIQRRPPPAQIAAAPAKSAPGSASNSRVNTMTTAAFSDLRADSMKITDREKADVKKASKQLPVPVPVKAPAKPANDSVETFQRGGYYS